VKKILLLPWRRYAVIFLALVLGTFLVTELLYNSIAQADQTSMLCSNTTYVDGTNSQSKKKNFGASTDLVIKGTTKFAFLECAVSGLPPDATGVSATLNVFSRSVNGPHTARLHNQPTSWVEGTGGNNGTNGSVNWNDLHTFDAAVLSSAPGDAVPGAGEWVNLAASTVTGNGTYRFALDTTTASDQFYASDDYTTDTTRRPKLTIDYTVPATTTTSTTTTTLPPGDPVPGGVPGSWTLRAQDEFDDGTLDTQKWLGTEGGGNQNNVTTRAATPL